MLAPMTVIKMPFATTQLDHLNVFVRVGLQEMEKHAKVTMSNKLKINFLISVHREVCKGYPFQIKRVNNKSIYCKHLLFY